MAKVEIYKLKKTAPPNMRVFGVFDYMRDGESPNALHYVREWAGEMHGNLPLTIPGRLIFETPKDYHGGSIINGDIVAVDGKTYFFDHSPGVGFIEIDFDAAAVRDEIHVKYGLFVDVTDAEAISDDFAYLCQEIGIPCGHLGEPCDTGIYRGKRPFIPGASDESSFNFLHPEFMKGEEAQTFTSVLTELTKSDRWGEISTYLRENYPAGQQDLEKARELFAPELLLPEELRSLPKHLLVSADESELTYLAEKLGGINEEQRKIFDAAIDARWHCGSVADIINLTDNLGSFELQPIFTPKEYGAHLINTARDEFARIMERLESAENPGEQDFFLYVAGIEANVDLEAYGEYMAEQDGGEFTELGYLTTTSAFQEFYKGPEDIPAEYRVSGQLPAAESTAPIMVCNTDLPALLLQMHALGGDYMKDANHNLQVLANGGVDFFVMMNEHMLTVTPAATVFRKDTTEHEIMMMLNNAPVIRTFVMSVEERENGRIVGSFYEVALEALQNYIRENSFFFTHLDAEMKDGTSRRFSLDEWDTMARLDRDQLKSWVKHYDPTDESRLETFLSVLRWATEENRQAVSCGQFLQRINEPYMSQANNPQPGMLRVTLEAAKGILAQNAADVFRLMPDGLDKLSPVDSTKTGLWFSLDREFAIRLNDLAGIDKWAHRAAGEMLRQTERGEHKKSRDAEI